LLSRYSAKRCDLYGRRGVILDVLPHLTRPIWADQSDDEVQSHVDAGGHPRGGDRVAVIDEPLVASHITFPMRRNSTRSARGKCCPLGRNTVASAALAASAVFAILCINCRAPCLTSKDLRQHRCCKASWPDCLGFRARRRSPAATTSTQLSPRRRLIGRDPPQGNYCRSARPHWESDGTCSNEVCACASSGLPLKSP
jgi:hypothetical protein